MFLEPEQGGWSYWHEYGLKSSGISSPGEELVRDNALLLVVHVQYPEAVLLRGPGLEPRIGASCLARLLITLLKYIFLVIP